MEHTKGKQKKCNKHGYYWVGLCCDGKIADDICPGCLRAAAPALLAACKDVRVELALLHRIMIDPPEFAKDPAVRKPVVNKIEERQKQVRIAIAAAQDA